MSPKISSLRKPWLHFNNEKLGSNMNVLNSKSIEKCSNNTLNEKRNWKGKNNWKKFAIKKELSNFKSA